MTQMERIKEKLITLQKHNLEKIVGEYGAKSTYEVYSEAEITEFESKIFNYASS